MGTHEYIWTESEIDAMKAAEETARFAEMYGAGEQVHNELTEALRIMALRDVMDARERVKECKKFIDEHGGNLEGYLKHYAASGGGDLFYIHNLADLMVAEAEYAVVYNEHRR